ncbi:MAG: glycosyltransferase family 9 protein [Bdellovibrionota bacterium]
MIVKKNDFSLLVILTGALGDLTRGLCITGYIKQKYPNAKISWLVENSLKDIVYLDKNIDDVIIFKRKDKLKGFLDTIKILKTKKFDIAFDMQRILKSGIFSIFSKAPIRVGFSKKDSKEFNFLFNNNFIPYYSKNTPKIKQYLAFLKFLDIDIDDEKEDINFAFTNGAKLKEEFKEALNGKTCIGLVLASQWQTKDWDRQNYVGLIKELLKINKDLNFVLIGTKGQKDISNFITENLNDASCIIDLCGKTNLEDLIAIFKNLKLGIGPDSGAGHIFASVHVPYISLFGPTIINRVVPYKMERLAIQVDLPCIPCYKRTCPLKHNNCMKNITPSMIINKIKEYNLL